MTSTFPTIFVIPSGVGCSLGGYAGDAIPSARLLAAASGCLITHPNVMNGAALYWSDPRIHYVEGFALDRFAAGELILRPVKQQRIGLLMDAGVEQEMRLRHLQVVDGCRASLGLNIGPVVITDVPLDIKLSTSSSGASWGSIGNPDELLRAGDQLKQAGATAIAVVSRFPDNQNANEVFEYRQGRGVDASAGAEAVISHLLVRHLSLPCAHAPALAPLEIDVGLDPRAAGEELGHTFLPCVLVGLSRAPDLLPSKKKDDDMSYMTSGVLNIGNVGAVIAPEGALGGETVLACVEHGIPLIAVCNPNVLKVTREALGLDAISCAKNRVQVFSAKNYVEAAGLILGLKEGISIESLNRPFSNSRDIY